MEKSTTNKAVIYGNKYVLIHKELILGTLINSYLTESNNSMKDDIVPPQKGKRNSSNPAGEPIKNSTAYALFYLFRLIDFNTFSERLSARSHPDHLTKEQISNEIFGTNKTFNEAITSLIAERIIQADQGDYLFAPQNATDIDIEKDFDNVQRPDLIKDPLTLNEFKANLYLEMVNDGLIEFPDEHKKRWNAIINSKKKSFMDKAKTHFKDPIYLNDIYNDIPTKHTVFVNINGTDSLANEETLILYRDDYQQWEENIEIGDITQGEKYVLVNKELFKKILGFGYKAHFPSAKKNSVAFINDIRNFISNDIHKDNYDIHITGESLTNQLLLYYKNTLLKTEEEIQIEMDKLKPFSQVKSINDLKKLDKEYLCKTLITYFESCYTDKDMAISKEESFYILYALQFADSYNYSKLLQLKGYENYELLKRAQLKLKKGRKFLIKKGIIELKETPKEMIKFCFSYYDFLNNWKYTDNVKIKKKNGRYKDNWPATKAKDIYNLYMKLKKKNNHKVFTYIPIIDLIATEYGCWPIDVITILKKYQTTL